MEGITRNLCAECETVFLVFDFISFFNEVVVEIYTYFISFMSGSTEGDWLALLMALVVGKQSFLIFQLMLLVLSY